MGRKSQQHVDRAWRRKAWRAKLAKWAEREKRFKAAEEAMEIAAGLRAPPSTFVWRERYAALACNDVMYRAAMKREEHS